MEHTDDPAFIQSFARGLSVIRAFDAERRRMSLSEVARVTGLTRATARRFLLTLEHLGYVRNDDRDFSLTPRVLELGFSYLSALSLPEVSQPHLERLSKEVGESSSASVLDGADIVYVARVPTRGIMTVTISIGTRFPAYATSMGRVLLAARPRDEQDAAVAQARQLTPRTLTDPLALRAELEAVAEQGWALVDQELEVGLVSLATPIRRAGEVVAAINLSTSARGDSIDGTVERLLEPLLATAREVSRDLDRGVGTPG